jgi:hypothetical protein
MKASIGKCRPGGLRVCAINVSRDSTIVGVAMSGQSVPARARYSLRDVSLKRAGDIDVPSEPSD